MEYWVNIWNVKVEDDSGLIPFKEIMGMQQGSCMLI